MGNLRLQPSSRRPPTPIRVREHRETGQSKQTLASSSVSSTLEIMRKLQKVYGPLFFLSCIPLFVGFPLTLLDAAHAEEPQDSKRFVGILTQIEGVVFLLSHPSSKVEGPSPRVKFENEYFTSERGSVGSQIREGMVIRTSPTGKARVIYTNGDQLQLGPGTVLKITALGKTSELKLNQGTLRGVVDSAGPMKRLRVRTRAATMGVRGTDFIIEDQGPKPGTKVVVLRGKVGLKSDTVQTKDSPEASKKQKESATEIAAGQAAELALAATPTTPVEPTVYVAPKAEIQETLASLKLTQSSTQPEAVSPELKKQIEGLEQAAIQVVVEDVRREDPEQAKILSEQLLREPSAVDLDQIQEKTAQSLIEKAPEISRPLKPNLKDLRQDSEVDVYKKYFDEG